MDFLSLDFRDPLYGVLILFGIVTIIYVSNYWARFVKKRDDDHDIEKFVKTFEKSSSFSEYKQMIQKQNLPTESVVLMALSYDKSGEYEKSIEIYSTLLKTIFDEKQKRSILTLLGKTYYKAGFLYKSRDIFMTTLKMYPKNEEALTYLVSIHESLREYDQAIEILKVLENINGDMSEKKLYFNILTILHDKELSNQEKIAKVTNLGVDKKIVQRKLFEFITVNNLPLDESVLKDFDFKNIIDLIWEGESELFSKELIKNNTLLSEVFTAKGKLKLTDKSDSFELNTLIKLQSVGDNSADLTFTYSCQKCKNVFPLYFYRCPVCKNINSASVETTLTRREYETGSFV